MSTIDRASSNTNHSLHDRDGMAGGTKGQPVSQVEEFTLQLFQALFGDKDSPERDPGGPGRDGGPGNTMPEGNRESLGGWGERAGREGHEGFEGTNHAHSGHADRARTGHEGMDHAGMGHADMSGAPASGSKAPADMVAGLGNLVDAEGNVTPANTGQHSGHSGPEMGHMLNVHATYEAASASGIDAETFMKDFVGNNDNYNQGQTDEQKQAGALTVLNDMTAARTMGGLGGDPAQLARTSGAATKAALAGDADGLRQILDGAGGNTDGMSDDMLLNTWSTNSHMYNHSILRTGSDPFALTHIRSLNDNAGDGTSRGDLGFYNDKGEYPQWDAQVEARRFLASESGKNA